MIRPAALLVLVLAVLALPACGGDESADALSLEQRVPSGREAPESKVDPVESRQTAAGVDEFVATFAEMHFVNPTAADLRVFRTTGFVRAVSDTRFFPLEPGAGHSRDALHLRTLVMQFGSDDGAEKAIDVVYEDSLRPCPEACAIRREELDSDVPNAHGVHRYATAEGLRELGDDRGRPFDSYAIQFADGQVAYVVELFGPPGKASAQQAEAIADRLYDRVHGAPLPGA